MRTTADASRRGASVKVLAVALIVLLELTAAVYLYMNPLQGESQNPFVIATSTTTKTATTSTPTTSTTHPPADQVAVESAMISNDTLRMEVHNLGPSSTEFLSVKDVCSPGFQTCYVYKTLAGANYKETFVLPAGRTFMANLSGICFIAVPSCRGYLPVAKSTYYLQVMFTFADGETALVPVSAMANNTWSRYLTAIMGINMSSLKIVPGHLTGLLNVTVAVNDSLPYASWTTLLDGYTKPSNGFSGTILSNETGCTQSGLAPSQGYSIPPSGYDYTADCSQGTFQVLVNFTTVLTGITPGPYYSLLVRDTTDIDKPNGYPNCGSGGCSNFALWIQSYAIDTIA